MVFLYLQGMRGALAGYEAVCHGIRVVRKSLKGVKCILGLSFLYQFLFKSFGMLQNCPSLSAHDETKLCHAK